MDRIFFYVTKKLHKNTMSLKQYKKWIWDLKVFTVLESLNDENVKNCQVISTLRDIYRYITN